MAPWLRVLEAYMVQALLRTPAFHRAVEKVARQVHRVRHGTPPEEMGGTKIDDPQRSNFMQHFVDEVKSQLTGAETKQTGGVPMDKRAFQSHQPKNTASNTSEGASTHEPQDAESVWHSTRKKNAKTDANPPKQGFLNEYMDALREQLRNEKSNR